jgi:hypothetical protein
MYLYETHLHTVQGSACGISPGRDYIRGYKALGYTGIIVTDHFFRGNTVVNRHLPWAEWVNQYCRGYEDARQEGERQGLDVFLGWEETFDGDDYLVYGLGKDWLLEHPEVTRWTVRQQYEEVRKYGGCVVHAHPFRERDYISRIHLAPRWVDAVEAANGGNEAAFDVLAARYGKAQGLPLTAGSDIHETAQLQTKDVFGVYLDRKMERIQDYVRAIREGAIAGLRVPRGRCEGTGEEAPSLPVRFRDD